MLQRARRANFALGRYRILRSIGSGGMSEVYLAYDANLAQPVAIKVLAERLLGNQSFINRFCQEGRLGSQLAHPNLVKAYDFGQDPETGKYFISMEYVDGLTAQERLERGGRFHLSEAARVILDICHALEYLHFQGYIHRDVKPGNILIGPNGHARLIDLGVAKPLNDDSALTAQDQGVGTPYYMPWEQGMNSNLVNARSDIFALGATFYHLVTGHLPFPGNDEAAIARYKVLGDFIPACTHIRRLPAVIDSILSRMLAREPRKRFASIGQVIEAITAAGLTEDTAPLELDDEPSAQQQLAPTRADLKAQVDIDTPLESGLEQIWLVKFQRPSDGAWREMRGRTNDIVRLYKDGSLPEQVFAAREPSDTFRRLIAYPEFREFVQRTAVSKEAIIEPIAVAALTVSHRKRFNGLYYAGLTALVLCSSAAAVMRFLVCLH